MIKSDLQNIGKENIGGAPTTRESRWSSSGVVGADEPLQWGRAPERARVDSLTAANGGPAPVLPAGPAAGENESVRLL